MHLAWCAARNETVCSKIMTGCVFQESFDDAVNDNIEAFDMTVILPLTSFEAS